MKYLEKIKIQLEKGNKECDGQVIEAQDANMTMTAFQIEDGNNILT